jgi:uncharacterized membrane protein YfcA
VMSVIAIVLGVGVGLALGALGGGGSTLAVPILVFIAGLTPQQATTASLLVVGVAAAVGAASHVRRGNVRLGIGLVFGISGIVGSRIGTTINQGIDGDLLLAGFAILIVFVAVRMYRSAPKPAAAPDGAISGGADDRADVEDDDSGGALGAAAAPHDQPTGGSGGEAMRPASAGTARGVAVTSVPRETPQHPIRLSDRRTLVRLLIAATGVGLLTGLFGVGGGFAIVPALVLVLGFGTKEAIGTSLVVIAVNAMVALGMRAGELDLDWAIVGPFLATVTVGVLVGTWVASRVEASRLTRSFAIMLAVVGAYTLVGALL